MSPGADALRRQADDLQRAGRLEAALDGYRRVLTAFPDDACTLRNMALAIKRQGDLDGALACYRRVLELAPDDALAWNNMGNALQAKGAFDEAEAALARAAALLPELAEAHNNLGNLLRRRGDLAAARACYETALGRRPDYAAAHCNLGNLEMETGRFEAAEACYRRALCGAPEDPEVLSNLGQSLRLQGRLAAAETATAAALARRPDFAEAHNHRGLILQDQGRIAEALEAFGTAMHLAPGDPRPHSNRLFARHYAVGADPAEQLADARKWWRRVNPGPATAPAAVLGGGPDDRRRLRVGYVSGDFRRHSVGFFLMPLLAHHDRRRVEICCYAQVRRSDEMTVRFRRLADRWRSIVGQDTVRVADRIRQDGVDILVDLAGHSADNRLDVFARRPAPVQVTWLGYPGTTGSPAIAFRITDAVADPPGQSDTWHSERLVRLPGGFLCYGPPEEAPAVGPPPSRANGFVTFGSFNTLPKINPSVLATWAALLRRVPASRLLIKCPQLADTDTRQRIAARFTAQGVAADRIRMQPKTPDTAAHLALYNAVDIGLDPFPYNGTTTTCEALFMGVPVVTWRGDRHSARVGASILGRVGLADLIARDPADYVARAAALAVDTDRCARLRGELRRRLGRSSLCDGAAFARTFEAALFDMWARRGTAAARMDGPP